MNAVSAARASVSLPSLLEFLRGLEFRQADIRRWHRRGGRFALGAHHQFRANKDLVTKERGCAKNRHREQKSEDPFHRAIEVLLIPAWPAARARPTALVTATFVNLRFQGRRKTGSKNDSADVPARLSR